MKNLLVKIFFTCLVVIFSNSRCCAIGIPTDFNNKISSVEKSAISDAVNLYNSGYKQEAIDLCTRGMSKYPTKPIFYLYRGFFYLENKNYNNALNDLNKTISLDPNFSLMPYFFKAQANYNLSNYSLAFSDFDKTINKLKSIKYPTGSSSDILDEVDYNLAYFIIYRTYAKAKQTYIANELEYVNANPNYRVDTSKLLNYYNDVVKYYNISGEHSGKLSKNYKMPDVVYYIEEDMDSNFKVKCYGDCNYYTLYKIKAGIDKYILLYRANSTFTDTTPASSKNNSGEVDFAPYMNRLQHKIKDNWNPPKGEESKRVIVMFKIDKNGNLLSNRIYQSSGNIEVDNAALRTIKMTAPFEPFPNGCKENTVDIQFTFDYNVIK